MSLYHFSVKQVKRSEGHTAIAAAAYISGEKLYDHYYGEVQDYTKKEGVVLTEIILPDHVPQRLADRETLWNEVENHENRMDAQLAYSFDFALQNELTMEENIELAERFVRENFTSRGMICDLAIHNPPRKDGEEPNPHAHGLVPMRPITLEGEWGAKRLHIPVFDEDGNPVLNKKGKQKYLDPFVTDWEKAETLEEWRINWEKIVNEKFEEKGLSCRVDHRSNEERGLDALPQVHEGSAVRCMEKRGITTYKGAWNRWVKKTNDTIRVLLNKIRELSEWITEAKERVHRIENPTVSNMVMLYFEHRNKVAEGYERGTQKAKKGNLQYVSKVQVYITQNNLTSIDDLEALVAAKNEELKKAKEGLDGKKSEVKEIKKNLKLLEDYYEYKPVFDEWNKSFFKAKREAYQKEHHAEMSKFYKARRLLKEQGHEESDFDTCREYWEARLNTLEDEIKKESEKIKNSPISEEVKMLGYIRDAVDFITGNNDDDDGDDGNKGSGTSGGASATKPDADDNKAKEQAAQEQAMQAAQLQAQQQAQASQNGHRERVSMEKLLGEKKEIVRKTEEAKRSQNVHEHDETHKKNRLSL